MNQSHAARSGGGNLVGLLGKLIVVAAAILVISVRFQVRWILDPIRRFNRRYYNRVVLIFAGERGTPYAVIRHVGRRSGQKYETPVFATPIVDGFLLALYYGAEVEWLRNLQAAGGGKIFFGGGEHPVGSPELIDDSVAFALLPEHWRLIGEIFGVKQYIRLREQAAVGVEARP